MADIAFIGLGTMGLPMSGHLIKGGHSVAGFDLNPDAVEKHRANGGTAAASPAVAAARAEFVITMLPDAPDIRAALFGDEGAAAAMEGGALYIDMSTINPLESDALRETLAGMGIAMVDAPVGRPSTAAIEAKSLIMAGGEKADIARVRPLFGLLGATIVDCGGPGMGHRMKTVNNYLSTAACVLTAEALTLSDAIGLDRDIAVEVMMGTPAGRGQLGTIYPDKALKGDLSPAFMIDLAHKDIGIALDLAATVNVPLMAGAAARQLYSVARARGRGRDDWTAVYPVLREMAGLAEEG